MGHRQPRGEGGDPNCMSRARRFVGRAGNTKQETILALILVRDPGEYVTLGILLTWHPRPLP